MKINRKLALTVCVIDTVLLIIFALSNLLFVNGQITVVNISIFMISLAGWNTGLFFLSKAGLNCFSVFTLIFWGSLSINTLHLSGVQSIKTIWDFYYYILGGCLFSFLLFYGEHSWVRKKKLIISKQFSAEFITNILLMVYYLLFLYIFSKTGVRIISGAYDSARSVSFVIPGVSGLTMMVMWILLMFIPYVKFKKKCCIVISTILLNGICMFKRGDIMRVLFFVILYYIYIHKEQILNKRMIRKIIIIFTVVIITFFSIGNIRTRLRNGGVAVNATSAINNSLQSNVNLRELGWVFGYTVINFDVLKLFYTEEPAYKMSSLLLPVTRLLHGSQGTVLFENRLTPELKRGVNGFNASTFLSNYILDFGMFFVVELFALGFIISLLIRITKVQGLTGPYIYIMLLTVLTILGDYYTLPNYVFSLFGGIMLTAISRENVTATFKKGLK